MKDIMAFAAALTILLFTNSASADLTHIWGNAGQITGQRADQSNALGQPPIHQGEYSGLGRMGVGDLYSQTNECRLFYHHTAALRSQYKAKVAERKMASGDARVARADVDRLQEEADAIYQEILRNGPRRNFPCPW